MGAFYAVVRNAGPRRTRLGTALAKGGGMPYLDEETGRWENLYTNYPPLTGPYYSADPVILEYQLLLMKYAGIDGVMPDWYGIGDKGTSEDKTANMEALWEMVKKTGLEMAVCYEDRMKSTVKEVAVASVKADLRYLRSTYFNSSSYSTMDGLPVLLIFGPIRLTGRASWQDCFDEALGQCPAFFTLYAHGVSYPKYGVSYGQYNWPNNCDYKTQYTTMMNNKQKAFIAGAWPGFRDCYNGVGNESQNTVTDHRDGEEFREQLDYAKAQKPAYLQLATWNDYGEATCIEPTYEFQYKFLELVQDFTGVNYTVKELKSIRRLYDLRKKYKDDTTVQTKLDRVFDSFNSLKPDEAAALMNEIEPE